MSRAGEDGGGRADAEGGADATGDAGSSGGTDATGGAGETSERGSAREPPGPSAHRVGTRPPACELCGGALLERHCRIICLNCGFQRDCSDP